MTSTDHFASFTLNPALDAEDLARTFDRDGAIQICDFLESGVAESLYRELSESADWRRVINGGDKVFEIPVASYAALPPEEIRTLDATVLASAAEGFQYRYETLRVPDDKAARLSSGRLLDGFAEALGSPPILDFLRQVGGDSSIVFADAQATRYQPGDFLTSHDDNVAGKNRRFAYVLSLSAGWRAEWGGLLSFTEESDSIVSKTIVPRFNALNLFRVPQRHHVGCVAPYAPIPRISITGWLRTERPSAEDWRPPSSMRLP